METWQKLAMESTLEDVDAWLEHAANSKVYCECKYPKQHAMEKKSLACARRLCPGIIEPFLPQAVTLHCAQEDYKDRKTLVNEEASRENQRLLDLDLSKEAAEIARKEELRAEILKMKEEGLI